MQGFESDAEKTAAEKGDGQKKNDESKAAKTQCVRNVAGANRGKMYAGGNTRRRKDAPHCLSKTRRRAKRRFVRLISLHTARFWDIIMAIRKFLKGVLSNEIRNDQTRHRGSGQKVCESHRALRLRPHAQERQICRGREVHSRHFQPRP